jgi:hypothetical protein
MQNPTTIDLATTLAAELVREGMAASERHMQLGDETQPTVARHVVRRAIGRTLVRAGHRLLERTAPPVAQPSTGPPTPC